MVLARNLLPVKLKFRGRESEREDELVYPGGSLSLSPATIFAQTVWNPNLTSVRLDYKHAVCYWALNYTLWCGKTPSTTQSADRPCQTVWYDRASPRHRAYRDVRNAFTTPGLFTLPRPCPTYRNTCAVLWFIKSTINSTFYSRLLLRPVIKLKRRAQSIDGPR